MGVTVSSIPAKILFAMICCYLFYHQGEMMLVFATILASQKTGQWCFTLPNRANMPFYYPYFLYLMVLFYIRGEFLVVYVTCLKTFPALDVCYLQVFLHSTNTCLSNGRRSWVPVCIAMTLTVRRKMTESIPMHVVVLLTLSISH